MTFNPLNSYLGGLQARQQQDDRAMNIQNADEIKQLSGALAQSKTPQLEPEFQRLVELDPARARQIMDVSAGGDALRTNAQLKDTKTVLYLLGNKDFQGVNSLLANRKQELGDRAAPGTDEMLQKAQAGDYAGIEQGMKRYLSFFDPDTKAAAQTKTASQKDWSTFQKLAQEAKDSGDPKAKARATQYGRKVGFIRETEQEKADIKVGETERKEVAKSNVARKQGFIDSGIDSANGVANLNRALNLLDEVETGGFDNVALKAKRLFGIEGGDEGELSNLMGKAVLAQLKPIFGAAFTAREGDALAALEAKFSNSPENNKRLLKNALKLADRAARRGIAAAEDQGDQFTADEIRNAMAFTLEDKIDQPENPLQPAQTPALSDEDLLKKYGG